MPYKTRAPRALCAHSAAPPPPDPPPPRSAPLPGRLGLRVHPLPIVSPPRRSLACTPFSECLHSYPSYVSPKSHPTSQLKVTQLPSDTVPQALCAWPHGNKELLRFTPFEVPGAVLSPQRYFLTLGAERCFQPHFTHRETEAQRSGQLVRPHTEVSRPSGPGLAPKPTLPKAQPHTIFKKPGA